MKESSKGTKALLSVYINKDVIGKIKDIAREQRRTISGQVELVLENATTESK